MFNVVKKNFIKIVIYWKSAHKIHHHTIKIIEIMGQKSLNLKFYNFCFDKTLHMKFLPDISYNRVPWWANVSGCSLTTGLAVYRKTLKNEVLEAWD